MIDAQGNYVPDTIANPVVAPVTAPVQTNLATPTPEQIYSSANIQQATTSPVTAPDLSNASSIYNYYMGTSSVTDAQKQAEADMAALNTAKANARNRQLAIEGNPNESMSYITGAQSRAGQLDNAALQALADTASVSSARYEAARADARDQANIALQSRAELLNMMQQNPNAGITFNDTAESATKKVRKYNDKLAKDAQKKADEEYKKNLKNTLIQLGISNKTAKNGTMSVKSMEKALTESYKSKADAEKKLNDLKLKSAINDLNKQNKSSISDITNLLTIAANMPSGGREFALANATKYGVDKSTIDSLTNPNTDWGKPYRSSEKGDSSSGYVQAPDGTIVNITN